MKSLSTLAMSNQLGLTVRYLSLSLAVVELLLKLKSKKEKTGLSSDSQIFVTFFGSGGTSSEIKIEKGDFSNYKFFQNSFTLTEFKSYGSFIF